MKVLITGGKGFIGSNLSDLLLEKGYEVWCLDNESTCNLDNDKHLESNQKYHFIKGDVREKINIPKVDFIFHLASPASVPHYQKDPIGTMMTGVLGTKNVLDFAVECKARVVFSSTSEVYGDAFENPQRESYNGNCSTLSKRSCYDESKRSAETLCYDYKRVHGLDARVARIFNTFGKRMNMDDGRILTNFIRAIIRNEP